MRFLLLVLPTFAAAVVAVACSSSSSSNAEALTADGGEGGSATPEASTPSSQPPPRGPAGSGLATGLPCDVQGILENRCIACHSTDTPPRLLTYEDLIAVSKKDPSKTMAQSAGELMRAKAMPPNPAAPPEDDEIASFEGWISAGTPQNPIACTDPPPKDGAAVDAGVQGGTTCTSTEKWTQGNDGSPLMNPGQACNTCHQQSGGPNLRIAGTVYPSLHEPNDCIGSKPPPQLRVVVTDAQDRTFNMPLNASGNFIASTGLFSPRPRPPFKAVVTDGVKTRAMVGSVTSGDCNSCHTVDGANGAPGRIMAP